MKATIPVIYLFIYRQTHKQTFLFKRFFNTFLKVTVVSEYTVTSLELLELRVPAHVPLGTRPSMTCRWQLGPTDILYSVKWYKDGKEFFRHVPRDVEPRRKFLLPGVDVEVCSAKFIKFVL